MTTTASETMKKKWAEDSEYRKRVKASKDRYWKAEMQRRLLQLNKAQEEA